MKPMTIVWLASALLVCGCSLDDYLKPDPNGDVKVSDNARIIDSASFQTYFHSLDSSTMTLRMDPAILDLYELKPGNILLSDRGRGLLRKIKTIETKDGQLIITTEATGLAQVIEEGNLTFSQDLSPLIPQAVIFNKDPGVTLLNHLKTEDDGGMKFSLEVNLASNIKVKGTLTVSPSIRGEASIDGASLEFLRIEFTMAEKFELTALTTIAEYNLEKEKTLLSVRFPTITIVVGVAPVLITPQFDLKLGVNLDLKSELAVSVTQDLTITAGFEYDGSWNPIYSEDHGFGRNGPTLTNTAEAKIYIKPQINLKIYDVVSPNFSTELYGLVEAELGKTPWWSLYAGMSGNIGCNVSVWDYELANFEAELFDLRFLIAEASASGDDPPMADFTVSPDSGLVTTRFSFNATNCRDIQTPEGELEVRWDWEGDGQWDTEFSTSKRPTHTYDEAGVHHPTLEVRDEDENTAQKSLELKVAALPNKKPSAKFSVDPPTGAHYARFTFDASESSDNETPSEALKVQWDWESDGNFDTPYSIEKTISRTFFTGTHRITLRVSDEEGYVDTETHTLEVFQGNTMGTLTDKRDNRTYKTVQIGSQLWMAENLNIGTTLTTNTESSNNGKVEKYCYNDDESFCNEYGGLYLWDEAMDYSQEENTRGICPEGWHIPSVDDWEELGTFLGGKQFAGSKMKEAGYKHWSRMNTDGNNQSGFTALPSGFAQLMEINGNLSGAFFSIYKICHFWSSTLIGDDYGMRFYGHAYHIQDSETVLVRGGGSVRLAYPVRCIKNN